MADEKLELDEVLEGAEDEGFVTLADEEGVEVEYEYIGSVDYEGAEYVVLLPVEDDENGEAEVLILKVESLGTAVDEDGEEYEDEQYVSVESEEVLDAVFALFKEQNADMFDFVEE